MEEKYLKEIARNTGCITMLLSLVVAAFGILTFIVINAQVRR